MRRDDDDRHAIARVPEPPQHFHTAQAGHQEVQEHELGGGASQMGEGLLAVPGLLHRIAVRLQGRAEAQPDMGLVIHDQNGVFHLST